MASIIRPNEVMIVFELTLIALVLGLSGLIITGSIAYIALIEISREKSK